MTRPSPEAMTAIDRRIESAIEFALENSGQIVEIDDEQHSRLSEFTALGLNADDDLTGMFAHHWPPAPNAISTGTREEFAYAMGAIAKQWGGFFPQQYITDQVAHESQHAVAMTKFGMHSIQFGVTITVEQPEGSPKKELGIVPYSIGVAPRQLRKLEVATLTALPSTLTKGDKIAIREMGYEGPWDVQQRILAINRAAGKLILPPLFGNHYPPKHEGSKEQSLDWL